jgi:hypothetical protein
VNFVDGSVSAFDDENAADSRINFCPVARLHHGWPAASLAARGYGVHFDFRVGFIGDEQRGGLAAAVGVGMHGGHHLQRPPRMSF